jgi:Domain of unknown function (DU1801)
MKAIDNFYLQQNEPVKSCFLALKGLILSQDTGITNELKYGMPFFCYKGKMFCYLWFHKKYKQPYIGIVEGSHFNEPFLIAGKRLRMKIMLIDAGEDLPVKKIKTILKKAIGLCKTQKVKSD